jgi:hypothetical protein
MRDFLHVMIGSESLFTKILLEWHKDIVAKGAVGFPFDSPWCTGPYVHMRKYMCARQRTETAFNFEQAAHKNVMLFLGLTN